MTWQPEIDELKRYDLRQGDWAGVTQQSSSLGTQHCAVPGAPPVAGAEVSGFQFAFQHGVASRFYRGSSPAFVSHESGNAEVNTNFGRPKS